MELRRLESITHVYFAHECLKANFALCLSSFGGPEEIARLIDLYCEIDDY